MISIWQRETGPVTKFELRHNHDNYSRPSLPESSLAGGAGKARFNVATPTNATVTCTARGGTQYKSGYRDVPQTWVAKSGRQVHQWVPFFFQKHGTLMGLFFKMF